METELIVEGEGLADLETIRIEEGSAGRTIIEAVAAKGGFPAEEGLLFIEDSQEPLDPEATVGGESANSVYHVHRARHIEVSVFYQNGSVEKRYSPATRIQCVLDWAVGACGFNIDKSIAPEMELALRGSTVPLPKDAHIGRYVRHPERCLSLDLVRGVVPNGASSL